MSYQNRTKREIGFIKEQAEAIIQECDKVLEGIPQPMNGVVVEGFFSTHYVEEKAVNIIGSIEAIRKYEYSTIEGGEDIKNIRIYAGEGFKRIGRILSEHGEDFDMAVSELIEDYFGVYPIELDYDDNNYINGFRVTTVQGIDKNGDYMRTVFYLLPEGKNMGLYVKV